MAAIIDVTDLPALIQSNELVDTWVAGANATAARVAPCLVDTATPPTADQLAEAKLVLIGMVQRWSQAGSGALSQESAGTFSQSIDTRSRTGFNPWPSEIQRLQEVCSAGKPTGAFSVDTAPSLSGVHADVCALNLGATYCSCGADIAGFALYEA